MLKYNKISEYKIKNILKLFCQDIPAIKLAEILGLNKNTTDRYYNIFREKIVKASMKEPVFGLLKRDGKVFVTIVKNCSKNKLPIIKGHVLEGTTVHMMAGKLMMV